MREKLLFQDNWLFYEGEIEVGCPKDNSEYSVWIVRR